MAINSRAKGKRGELEWRDVLRDAGYEARRGQQFSGGADSPDVIGGPPGFHWEVKLREKHDFWAAMEQAEHDARAGLVPCVAARRNHRPWLVVLRAEDFLQLVAGHGNKHSQQEVDLSNHKQASPGPEDG